MREVDDSPINRVFEYSSRPIQDCPLLSVPRSVCRLVDRQVEVFRLSPSYLPTYKTTPFNVESHISFKRIVLTCRYLSQGTTQRYEEEGLSKDSSNYVPLRSYHSFQPNVVEVSEELRCTNS